MPSMTKFPQSRANMATKIRKKTHKRIPNHHFLHIPPLFFAYFAILAR